MSDLSVIRTPETIATEINLIIVQTRQLMLTNSITVGQKLLEAKEMMESSAFKEWLKKAVDISLSTANNLIRVYQEYGADQGVLFGSAAKNEAVEKLSYTQAVLLLGVPAEQREELIVKEHIDEMSTRQLQSKIKELKEAKEQAEKSAKNIEAELSKEKSQREAIDNKLKAEILAHSKLKDENDKKRKMLESKATELRDRIELKNEEVNKLSERVKELEAELAKPVTIETVTVEKVPEEITKELEELRAKLDNYKKQKHDDKQQQLSIKLKLQLTSIVADINQLLAQLDAVEEAQLGAGVCKAALNALNQTFEQFSRRLENFEKNI